jgi:DNA-binding transcriptional LysR family regulator
LQEVLRDAADREPRLLIALDVAAATRERLAAEAREAVALAGEALRECRQEKTDRLCRVLTGNCPEWFADRSTLW